MSWCSVTAAPNQLIEEHGADYVAVSQGAAHRWAMNNYVWSDGKFQYWNTSNLDAETGETYLTHKQASYLTPSRQRSTSFAPTRKSLPAASLNVAHFLLSCNTQRMLLTSLTVPVDEFEAATGWEAKPQGMCKGDMCVPALAAITDEGLIDIEIVAPKLGMALEEDLPSSVWALGPESGGRALTTTKVPELELPDVNGNPFKLTSLLGRKVLLVAWASW